MDEKYDGLYADFYPEDQNEIPDEIDTKRLFVITGDPGFGQTEKCKQVWALVDKTCTVLHTDRLANQVDRKKKSFWQWGTDIQTLIHAAIAKIKTDTIICVGQTVLFDSTWPGGQLNTDRKLTFDLFEDGKEFRENVEIKGKYAIYSDPVDLEVVWKEMKWICPLSKDQLDDCIIEMCNSHGYLAGNVDQMKEKLDEEHTLEVSSIQPQPAQPSEQPIPQKDDNLPIFTSNIHYLGQGPSQRSKAYVWQNHLSDDDDDVPDLAADEDKHVIMERRQTGAITRHYSLLASHRRDSDRKYNRPTPIPNTTMVASMSHDPTPLPDTILNRFALQQQQQSALVPRNLMHELQNL